MRGLQKPNMSNFMKNTIDKTTTNDKNAAAFKLSPKARIVPKNQRLVMPPEAHEPRNIKVRTNIHFDLDILNYFKERASLPGASPYQTQMNAELRKIMERDQGQDQASGLKEALEQAARSLRKAIKFADEAEVVPKRR